MKKLLIVDDSSMMRQTIEQNLGDYELEIVGTAGNGKEALEMVQDKKPDVVTLDITMPEMDGLDCLEKMMKIAPETRVMIITALSDKLTGLEALKKGAREYLYKPVTHEDLREGFDLLLNKK
ncbi:MAG: response regulator [Cyclobacteriaceae bacterium]|nr:response regulator [Cyclobacteriaceae bacterium HetDA_MAG_MS6]